jgi:N-acetylglucosaminyldiphosphoundecaprenol N-acetyl-beta-D-mannosaminyltransferase
MSHNRVNLSQMKFETRFNSVSDLINFSRSVPFGNFFFCSASTIARASSDPELSRILSSGFAIPDSTPLALVLTGNRKSVLRGTTFTREFCESSLSGERIALIGSTVSVLEILQTRLQTLNHQINIVGVHSPSFVGSVAEKARDALIFLNDLEADFVFVALSSPQQDYFIGHLSKQYQAKYFAVGAAFDFIAGTKSEAPKWLQQTGLEWLFRLGSEPRRLWKRYLIDNLVFMSMSLQFFAMKVLKNIKNAKQ